MNTRAANLSAIENATGRSWEDWVQRLDAQAASELEHALIARAALDLLPDELPNPEWWAQSVAVAYEQHIGRRRPGQGADGSFQGSVSRTVGLSMDGALAAWRAAVAGMTAARGVDFESEPKVSGSEKWRYWRVGFVDGSRVSVDITEKSADRSTLSVNHTKVVSPEEVAAWKECWRTVLQGL